MIPRNNSYPDCLTLLSLSNSISMTACLALRCLRMNSRMYGMRLTMMDRDCEARAGLQISCIRRYMQRDVPTQVFSSDVLETSRTHSSSAQNDLTCPGIERLERYKKYQSRGPQPVSNEHTFKNSMIRDMTSVTTNSRLMTIFK